MRSKENSLDCINTCQWSDRPASYPCGAKFSNGADVCKQNVYALCKRLFQEEGGGQLVSMLPTAQSTSEIGFYTKTKNRPLWKNAGTIKQGVFTARVKLNRT